MEVSDKECAVSVPVLVAYCYFIFIACLRRKGRREESNVNAEVNDTGDAS